MDSTVDSLLANLHLSDNADTGSEREDPLPDASPVEAAASAHVGLPVRLITTPSAAAAATEHLRRHPTLAVDCEDVNLSRTGRLCTVQVASPTRAYVFDLVADNSLLQPGMADLLSDEAVVKVFHDCRHDAEALAHQAGVWVKGVRDTQVAYGLSRLHAGQSRPIPVSLTTLFRLHAPRSRGSGGVAGAAFKGRIKARYGTTPDLWAVRPLDVDALTYATTDVVHLVTIHAALARRCGPRAEERLAVAATAYAASFRDRPEGVGEAAARADFQSLCAAADAGRARRRSSRTRTGGYR